MERKMTKKLNLLIAIELIVEKAKDSQLSKEFFRKADKYIKYVSDKLDLTKEQSLMFALFINKSDDDSIQLGELSDFVKCSTVHLLRYTNDIDELEKKEYVRCCRSRSSYRRYNSYRVPLEVLEAIKHDEKYTPQKCTDLTCQELFGELEDIFEMRKDDEITYDMMMQKIHALFEDNRHLHYVNSVDNLNLSEEEEMLMVLFCHLCVNNNDDNIGYHDLDFLYDNKRMWNRTKSRLSRGSHMLFYRNVIEYNNDNGMVDRESYRLTQDFKEEYLSEVKMNTRFKESRFCELIESDKVAKKKLYYGQSIQKQIDELSELINESHYREITTRLKESGFRNGFSCLFYGGPGTGKTETVLQLARQTG